MNTLARLVSFPAPFLIAALATSLLVGCTRTDDSKLLTMPTDGIIGGEIIGLNHAVAQSTVLLYNTDLNKALCTATLLSSEYAVTAAHCVEDFRTEGFQLVFSTQLDPLSPRRQVVSAKTSVFREAQQKDLENMKDYALIRFTGGLPKGYHPALILSYDYLPLLKVGTPIVVAGYGLEKEEKGSVGILRVTNVKLAKPHFTGTEMLLDQREGHGTCQGDSGGPAFVYIKGKYYFWGITSHGANYTGELVEGCDQFVVATNAVLLMPAFTEMMDR
jgi:hypothetical protein